MKTRIITSVFIGIVLAAILLLSNTIAYSVALSILAVIAANEVLKVYDVDKKYLVSVPAYIAAAAMPIPIKSLVLVFMFCISFKKLTELFSTEKQPVMHKHAGSLSRTSGRCHKPPAPRG